MIDIMLANKEDFDTILQIKQNIWENMINKEWYEIEETDKEYLNSIMENEGIILKAVSNGKIVGFLTVSRYLMPAEELVKILRISRGLDKCIEMDSVGVIEEYRGQHIQQRMILEAEKILLNKDEIKYSYTTVHPDNLASLKSFTNLGYKIILKTKMYNGKDRMILCKEFITNANM